MYKCNCGWVHIYVFKQHIYIYTYYWVRRVYTNGCKCLGVDIHECPHVYIYIHTYIYIRSNHQWCGEYTKTHTGHHNCAITFRTMEFVVAFHFVGDRKMCIYIYIDISLMVNENIYIYIYTYMCRYIDIYSTTWTLF